MQRFYLYHGIKFRSAKKVYEQTMMNSDVKHEERIEYARILGNIIAQDRPIIYVDETTFQGQVV